MLFALVCASPVQAFDWFDSLFGTSVSGGGGDPSGTVYVPMGPSGGGGDPGVDPE